jgi:hypothetical protein
VATSVLAASPAEPSGSYSARYASITNLVLPPGNYVVFSTQNGDNFIAPNGSPTATLGTGITWNKGVALGSGSAAGPVPDTAPASWPIENTNPYRYCGPTFKYQLGAVPAPMTISVASPTNNQSFLAGTSISATATVTGGTPPFAVTYFRNNGSGTGVQVGSPVTSLPYTVSVGVLPIGAYGIYATVTDSTGASSTSATNAFFSVSGVQQSLALTGWNQDIIVGKTETVPGYTASMAGFNYYESGLTGGTQGLPADSGPTPRTFTSSYNPSVKFQFAPYAGNNAVFLSGAGNVTLTLNTPAKFLALQFLETTRNMNWYARLNFADGSNTTTSTWSDPDWTANPGPGDRGLTSYGLRGTGGNFYTGYLWMADREITLSAADQVKTLNSITIFTTSTGDQQLALFAVSGTVFSNALSAAVTTPANNLAFPTGTAISATATVAGGTPPYAVTFYTNVAGSNVQVGVPATSSPYTVTVGTPPEGSYGIYATVSDSASGLATSPTNAFTVTSASNFHAVNVLSAGNGPQNGGNYSVGWDFTVNQTITIKALGQFDPDVNPQTNTVAIYQRGGAKLGSVSLLATSPTEQSGIYAARYAAVPYLVLPPGNYVVFSTQNGDNFISGGGAVNTALGLGITWNFGVAQNGAAGPLPATAPATWPITNAEASRYFGPTFKYDLGVTLTPWQQWASAYAGGQQADEDYNKDGVANGVAFMMGKNGIATNPSVETVGGVRTVTWPYENAVATAKVQVSTSLTDWADATEGVIESVPPPGGYVKYTLPAGKTTIFCRLLVIP